MAPWLSEMAPACAPKMCLSLLILVTRITARSEEFDFDYPSNQPTFLTEPSNFTVREGESVILPCEIRDLKPYPVVWRRGNRVLSAGATITAVERRFRLVHGHSLQIDRVRVRDTGEFVCSVPTDPVTELAHQLDVTYGPTVTTNPETGMVVAQKGTDETLQCSATGKPTPQLIWRKQSGLLPDGHETHAGGQYRLSQISRQMAGVYECVADNGQGQTAVGRISLQVQYPPEVEVEKSTVYTGEGYMVRLACFVFADPQAEVVWNREGTPLDPERHVTSEDVSMGTRHSLVISNVQQDDFGTYSCHAANDLGAMKRRMIVTGVADRVKVTSASVGTAPEEYDLSWKVESYGPIKEYKVAYRRTKFNMSSDVPSGWKEVIVPTTGTEPREQVHFQQRIILRHLQPETMYDLYIQARNAHGWNAVSEIFHFSTLSRGEALESRIADTAVGSVRRIHPLLGGLMVTVFIILPAIF